MTTNKNFLVEGKGFKGCRTLLHYSLKFLRTKIFMDFVVFEAPTKIYPQNF